MKNDFDKRLTFREWDDYNLSEDAYFDKYALDIEAEDQTHLMCKWLELLTEAQAELSKAKEVMANVEAKIFLKVKTEGVSSLGSKPTEATVKAYVHTQPDYRKAQRRKRKAENNVHYLQNARSVLEHRKTMIKVEADLWICGYFSKPHIKGDIKSELEEGRRKQHSEKLEESLKKRHKRADISQTNTEGTDPKEK